MHAFIAQLDPEVLCTGNEELLRQRISDFLHPILLAKPELEKQIGASSDLVETLFHVPGIGDISIESIRYRDYPVIQGTALLVAGVYVLVNLGVDLLYGVVDPRIRGRS